MRTLCIIFGDRNRYKNMISIISLPLEFLNHPQNLKKCQGPSGRIFHYMEIAIFNHRKKCFGGKDKNTCEESLINCLFKKIKYCVRNKINYFKFSLNIVIYNKSLWSENFFGFVKNLITNFEIVHRTNDIFLYWSTL